MRTRALLLSSSILLVPAASSAQEAEQLDVITVETAARDTRGLLETPAAVTVRDRAALEQKQAATSEELIGDAHGVTIGGGPRGFAQEPNIRGFTAEQVALRFDGGRFNFNQAHRGRLFLDPEIIETVEIVRGGGSTLTGSGALGGVVSVRTREARDLLARGESVGARVSSGFVSNGEIGQGSLTAYGAAGAFDALAFAGFRRQGSDLTDGAGDDILDSATDADNALVKLGLNAGESHRFTLSGAYWRDDGTTAPNANAVSTPGARVDRAAEVGALRLGWDYAPAGSDLIDLSALVYGDVTRIEEDRESDGRADKTDYDTLGFELVNRSQFDAGLPVRLIYGVEAYRDEQTGERDGAARPGFPDAADDFVAGIAEATVARSDTVALTPGALRLFRARSRERFGAERGRFLAPTGREPAAVRRAAALRICRSGVPRALADRTLRRRPALPHPERVRAGNRGPEPVRPQSRSEAGKDAAARNRRQGRPGPAWRSRATG